MAARPIPREGESVSVGPFFGAAGDELPALEFRVSGGYSSSVKVGFSRANWTWVSRDLQDPRYLGQRYTLSPLSLRSAANENDPHGETIPRIV